MCSFCQKQLWRVIKLYILIENSEAITYPKHDAKITKLTPLRAVVIIEDRLKAHWHELLFRTWSIVFRKPALLSFGFGKEAPNLVDDEQRQKNGHLYTVRKSDSAGLKVLTLIKHTVQILLYMQTAVFKWSTQFGHYKGTKLKFFPWLLKMSISGA